MDKFDFLALAGLALLAGGLYLIYAPLALIITGLFLLGVGLMGARNKDAD